MWKLLNKLFKYDYVQWRNTADQGVARVHKDGAGKVWYWRYKLIKVADIVRHPDDVIWLTCSPDKYFQPSVNDYG